MGVEMCEGVSVQESRKDKAVSWISFCSDDTLRSKKKRLFRALNRKTATLEERNGIHGILRRINEELDRRVLEAEVSS